MTFANVEKSVADLEKKLYQEAFQTSEEKLTKAEILRDLTGIRQNLVRDHNGLFAHLVEDLINKAEIFGLYFATLDIRQEASEHGKVLQNIADITGILPGNYSSLSETKKIDALLNVSTAVDADGISDELSKDTLKTIAAVKQTQQQKRSRRLWTIHNQPMSKCLACDRGFWLFLLGGWQEDDLTVDIVPLFETITDLRHAPAIMRELYNLPAYREHIARRQNRQTIMLGFSDGTKDGGYLMANWSIYKAKDELTRLSREFGLNIIFFDGRGGPPARGGGKTHKFYSSMGQNIADDAIELTIQGQTVSSNFGTVAYSPLQHRTAFARGHLQRRLRPERSNVYGTRR